jgi:hypothetical protein
MTVCSTVDAASRHVARQPPTPRPPQVPQRHFQGRRSTHRCLADDNSQSIPDCRIEPSRNAQKHLTECADGTLIFREWSGGESVGARPVAGAAILLGDSVILSAAKNLAGIVEILRCAQNDWFARISCRPSRGTLHETTDNRRGYARLPHGRRRPDAQGRAFGQVTTDSYFAGSLVVFFTAGVA